MFPAALAAGDVHGVVNKCRLTMLKMFFASGFTKFNFIIHIWFQRVQPMVCIVLLIPQGRGYGFNISIYF
jgi:hypothetical protein